MKRRHSPTPPVAAFPASPVGKPKGSTTNSKPAAKDGVDVALRPPSGSRKPNLEPLLTVAQVAWYLQLSDRHIRRLIADGTLPCIRIGASIRIAESVVAVIIKSNKDYSQIE